MRWWYAEPWDELERVAATFPAPDDFEVDGQYLFGERPAVCDLKPCASPGVRVEYRRVDGGGDPCTAVPTGADAWQRAGFEIHQRRHTWEWTGCVIDGEIDGHGVQLLDLPDEGGGARFAIIVWY
jgi:hypothetical protein